MASASEPAALLVKNASLKDAANRAAMKLGYTRGVKEEHLEKWWWLFCLEVMFLSFFLLDLERVSAMHACILLRGD